jgi:hypothetical protein
MANDDLRAVDFLLRNHKHGQLPNHVICQILRIVRELELARRFYPLCDTCGERHLVDIRCGGN